MSVLHTAEYLFWEFSLLAWGAWLASLVLQAEAGPETVGIGEESGHPGRDVRFVMLALLFNIC